MNLTHKRRWLLLITLAGLVLLVDQVTKAWVVQNIQLGDSIQPIPALSEYFEITHSTNTGAAFGFFPDIGNVILLVRIIVIVAMVYFYPRLSPTAHASRIAIGLICGGALGNVLDQVRFGHVTDFIHYQIPGVISNVSNIADHAVVLGVIIILVESWWSERHKPDAETPANPEHNSETPL